MSSFLGPLHLQVEQDQHSPPHVRVNAALAQVECTLTTGMYEAPTRESDIFPRLSSCTLTSRMAIYEFLSLFEFFPWKMKIVDWIFSMSEHGLSVSLYYFFIFVYPQAHILQVWPSTLCQEKILRILITGIRFQPSSLMISFRSLRLLPRPTIVLLDLPWSQETASRCGADFSIHLDRKDQMCKYT
jgi:hypothetical protein